MSSRPNSAPAAPAIAPSRDDIEARRNQRGPRAAAGDGVATGHLAMLYFVVVVLIAGLAAAGWFIVGQQQQLAVAEAALVSADTRLKRLEERLSITDKALTGQGSELQDQISLWEREARRAWQVAYNQNRPKIEALETRLDEADKKLAEQARMLAEARATLTRHDAVLGSQQQVMERLSEFELRLAQLVNGQRDLTDAVNASRTLTSGIKTTLDSHDEAIRAIDAFRAQTNRTLLELRARTGESVTPPPAR